MRYTVTKQRIQMIGPIWMPAAVCAMERDLDSYDMSNLGDATNRDDVEHWLCLNSGDFQSISDFRADFHVDGKHIVHEWAKEDSEWVFSDAMYPSED